MFIYIMLPVMERLFFTCVVCFFFCACSVRTIALRATAKLIDAGRPAFYEESDPKFARESMPSQLKLMEALLRSDPSNPRLLAFLSEGYVGYAFLFLEDEEPDRAREFYRRALGYALRLAALNPAFAELSKASPEQLKAATAKDVPGLYWAAYAWAGWANLAKGDAEALSGMPTAARVMERVRELAPDYQFRGPDLFLGVYYAALPRLAGGDPDKAKSYFDHAVAGGSGNFLMAKLLYAKYYAVAALDEALFRRLNEEVLAARADALPAARLANETAKLKAKRLLEKTHELF